jgi:hypothetical protein
VGTQRTTTTTKHNKEQQSTKAPTTAARMNGKKKKRNKKATNSEEPKIPWKKSEANWLLYKDIMNGEVPLEAKDAVGKLTMALHNIYIKQAEYSLYSYEKFLSHLSLLRKTINCCPQ